MQNHQRQVYLLLVREIFLEHFKLPSSSLATLTCKGRGQMMEEFSMGAISNQPTNRLERVERCCCKPKDSP